MSNIFLFDSGYFFICFCSIFSNKYIFSHFLSVFCLFVSLLIKIMPRSRSRARSSSSSSTRRSRSPLSDHDSDHDRSNEYRVHIADLPTGVQEHEIRKTFQRFGPLMDVWVANASCFAFAVYKYKDNAQKAIDQMDGRYENELMSDFKRLSNSECLATIDYA